MFVYEYTPVQQESCCSYATNTSATDHKITYHFPAHPDAAIALLHAKIDRVLLLLEDHSSDQEDELVGTMSTQEAAAFIAISKRTFERKVKQGLISPIAKNMNKNRFLKRDVVQFFIAYRGYKPTYLP
ncbi:helix-turn-helix domain-containing protein [Sphingobacterium kitahiroshimense]|uniref:Helix-turn-helix domain-containing protein n=1 Tax=Sphingobacterium kitahiroshimense TaxID=470446 RepID=A0ABV0BPH2_9SPHI